MRKSISAMMFCSLLAGLGCQGSASFKEKTANGGVVELQAKGDMKDVLKLIEQQTGKDNYELTEVTPPTQPNGQPNDGKKYFAYRKKTTTTPAGLPPAPGGQIQQTGGMSTGRLPQPTIGMQGTGYVPGVGQTTPQQPGYTPGYPQPGTPTGRGSFAGDR